MCELNKIKNRKNSRGQAILFAVVAVTVALALGVTVASRNLSSTSRVTTSDSSAKAIAAAEGGAERMLGLNDNKLYLLSIDPPSEADPLTHCDSLDPGVSYNATNKYCEYKYSVAGDKFETSVKVKVDEFTSNVAGGGYNFSVDNGYTKEVTLRDRANTYYGATTIKICWKEGIAALYYYSYDIAGQAKKGALVSEADNNPFLKFNRTSQLYGFGFTPADAPVPAGTYCKIVDLVSTTAYGLRIMALYAMADVTVYPTGTAVLPIQGYTLTSIGTLGDVSRKVVVYRSNVYMPSIFDSAIFSRNGGINPTE